MIARRASRIPYSSHLIPRTFQRGFTIVELLIVVVVIAILAAITIVAYNGITDRASAAVLQNDLAQARDFMEVYKLDGGLYPADLQTAVDAGLKVSASTQLTYTYNTTNNTYSLTGADARRSYFVSSEGPTTPALGAWLTNYAANPGFETSATSNWSPYWSPTRVLSTAEKQSGASSLSLKQATTTAGRGDGMHMTSAALPDIVEGATYRASFWAKVPTGTYLITALKYNTGTSGRSSKYVTGNGAWQRVELDPYVVTAADVGNSYKLGLQILMTASGSSYTNPAVGTEVFIDNVAFYVTPPGQYSVASGFADGSTAGWSWNGTANASTSQGPSQP